MSDGKSAQEQPRKASAKVAPAAAKIEIESLVSAEIQRQLDRERNVIKDAGSFALKIIGGAFALLLAIFTVFGLTTWRDVAKETTEYMKQKVDALVQSEDAASGVKQTINDLVNHAIVDQKLTSLERKKNSALELSKYEWDRLKTWLKLEQLDVNDFSDVLAVLNAQSEDRKKFDANSQLSEMLSPPTGSSFHWMIRQPDKRSAIMSSFQHLDMGKSALDIAQNSTASEAMRVEAITYIGEIQFLDAFDKLIAIYTSGTDSSDVAKAALSTAALLRPTNQKFLKQVDAVISNQPMEYLEEASKILLNLEKAIKKNQSSFEGDGIRKTEAILLSFILNNGGYFQIDRRPDFFASNRFNQDDDDDGGRVRIQPTPTRVLLSIPTGRGSAEGYTVGSVKTFSRFEPYWRLLADAANAGKADAIGGLLFRTASDVEADVEISLGEQSEIVVAPKNSTSPITLRKKDISTALLRNDGKNGIKINWTENGKNDEGVITSLSGQGFAFSLKEQRTGN